MLNFILPVSCSMLSTSHKPIVASPRLSAFTLVEVLFAVFFLTVGVFGVYSLIINNQRIVEANRNFASAVMLAEQGLVLGQTKATAILNGNQNVSLQPKQTGINDQGMSVSGGTEQVFDRSILQCGTIIYSQIEWTDALGGHTKTLYKPLTINGTKNACTLSDFP